MPQQWSIPASRPRRHPSFRRRAPAVSGDAGRLAASACPRFPLMAGAVCRCDKLRLRRIRRKARNGAVFGLSWRLRTHGAAAINPGNGPISARKPTGRLRRPPGPRPARLEVQQGGEGDGVAWQVAETVPRPSQTACAPVRWIPIGTVSGMSTVVIASKTEDCSTLSGRRPWHRRRPAVVAAAWCRLMKRVMGP